MSLKWKYFLSKRRLTPSTFMTARRISSYDSLVKVLTQLEVEVPPFDEVGHLFLKPSQVPDVLPPQAKEMPSHSNTQADASSSPAILADVTQDPQPAAMLEDVPNTLDSVTHAAPPVEKAPFRRKKSSKASSLELPSTGSNSENEGA